jgi:hypothetical protein
MAYFMSRRQFFRLGVIGGLGLGSAGCGTILYPERRGQPPGPLDWGIVALDALGLLLFFLPGVIAFAVDFNNGTIYLPAVYYGAAPRSSRDRQLVSVNVPRDQLTRDGIEQVVSQHAKRTVQLTPGGYRTKELESADQFWPAHDALAGV